MVIGTERQHLVSVGVPPMATPVDSEAATPVIESTESDAIHVKAEHSLMTDEQWRAMRTVIEFVVNYKDREYVLDNELLLSTSK